MRQFKAPDVVVRRLAVYLRTLEQYSEADRQYVSSQELGQLAGFTPAQVRKDLAMFGEFGKQGVGYDVHSLQQELKRIMHADQVLNVALIGAGELGIALARYIIRRGQRQDDYPFHVIAAFDADPHKIGLRLERLVEIQPAEMISEVIRELAVSLCVITVPATAAQQVVDAAIAGGARAFLNFAPAKVSVPEGIALTNADMTLELQQLAYYL